jgi:trk system potassium uptake protein TrkH
MAVTSIVSPAWLGWNLGHFLAALGVALLAPTLFSLITDQRDLAAFAYATLASLLASALLLWTGRNRPRRDPKPREAILLVVLVWLAVCLFGALPFLFCDLYRGLGDALFESTSGFTTTGASVIADVERLSLPMHLWRSISHWLGGMGIILLGIAILPVIAQNSSGLYRAEFSGAQADRLHPRVLETARALWKIYLALTLATWLVLMAAGMNTFEAICHAFSTVATGGFSTRTESIAGFHSPAIEYALMLFMLLAGVSFVQHFRLWSEHDRCCLRDSELRSYLWIMALASTVIVAGQLPLTGLADWEPILRSSLFQVISIQTSTGFVSADFSQWQPLAQLILIGLMFVGGCTGSTAGGLKVSRLLILMRMAEREFRRLAEPQGVFRVHLDQALVDENSLNALTGLIFLALMTLLGASLILTAAGVDLTSAITAVIACQFNIGPGLGQVGPTGHFGDLPEIAKWTLSFCMLAGRLEFYSFLVVFTVAFWRR